MCIVPGGWLEGYDHPGNVHEPSIQGMETMKKSRIATCLGLSSLMLISFAAHANDGRSMSLPDDIDCHPLGMQIRAIETAAGSGEYRLASLKLEKLICKLKDGKEHEIPISDISEPRTLQNEPPRFPGEKLYGVDLTSSNVPLTMVFQGGGGNDLHWADLTISAADESKLRDFLSK
jgi:hypothetical protein